MAAMSAKPEMPTFSYAQAAKGLPVTPQTAKAPSTDASKTSPTPDEETTNSSPQSGSETVTAEPEVPRAAEKTTVSADKESEPAPATKSKQHASGTSSPSVGTSSTSANGKDDETSNAANGTSDSTWDKQSQASSTEKPNNGTEGAKKKSKSTSEKPAPPKELKAAPLPAVNIWQQRKEAQAKVIASLKPAKGASTTPGSGEQDQPKTASKKKDGVSDGAKDRKKTDGRKAQDGK